MTPATRTESPKTDSRWMARALELAGRGRCGVSPNPMVGAVVLDRHRRLAAEGFHAAWGGRHAEVVALEAAGGRARGGTLYVNLEPCAHRGKTPPCTDAVLEAGIVRLVVAMRDPHPVAGGGLERLADAGVEVEVLAGDWPARAALLNRRWLRFSRDGRPWITLKAAVSLDGRTATRTGQSQWITGPQARGRGHEMREEHDAILVGVGTVLADDPRLDRRLGLNPVDRWRRVILDSALRTPTTATVVCDQPSTTTIVHAPDPPAERRHALDASGVRLLEVEADASGRPRIDHLLDRLAGEEVAALMVEGGATVHGAFVDAALLDEVVLFIAPMILGGPAPPAVAGAGVAELCHARRLTIEGLAHCGDDVELRAVVHEVADVHRAG